MKSKYAGKFQVASAIALMSARPAFADPVGGGEYGYHGMMHGAGNWFMMPIMMLIFFGLLVLAVVLIVRFLGFSAGRSGHSDSAKSILRERFAKGDIEREDFEARMKALSE